MLQVFATGNIGRDAETRAAGQDTVTSFSVASSRKVKGENTTTWLDCSLFGKRGEALRQYLVKGTRVSVSGELSTREHDGKTYLKIRVNEIDFQSAASREPRDSQGESKSHGGSRRDEDSSPGYTRHPVSAGAGAGDDEDLPFARIGDVG